MTLSFLQINFHKLTTNGSVPDDVPDSTVSGINISAKLQDIYIKNGLFQFHISKVKEYLEGLWGNPQSVAGPLLRIKGGLPNHLTKIKAILIHIDMPLPTTATPPQLSHNHNYAKKEYGRNVIVRLKDWLTQVQQVIEEVSECDN